MNKPLRKPRVSYYSFDSLGNPWLSGGGAVRDFEILKRFARHADVTLYVGRFPGFMAETIDGVKIRGLGFGKSNASCRLMYALAANVRILFDRADHIGMSPSVYAPVLAGLLRGRRHYMIFHVHVARRALQKYGLFGLVPMLCEYLSMRFVRRSLAVNSQLTAHIRTLNPHADVVQTGNGFDPGLLTRPVVTAVSPFILYVGRADIYMKGIDLLIQAWKETLAVRGIGLTLVLRGQEVGKVRSMIPPELMELARIEEDPPQERKAELLSSCLFFVSPSRFEGFGIAALEANATGKAVLATDNEGFRDSMAAGETALLVPVEDIEALKGGMTRLADDPELREAMGCKGRQRAARFSWDRIAEFEWNWVTGEKPVD